MRLKVGIIGYGYWGPNLVRNFYHLEGCTIEGIAEKDTAKQQLISKSYPTVTVFNDGKDLIINGNCDAIIIATSVLYHYELALLSLQYKKHVLIEKPIVTQTAQLKTLIDLAQKNNKVLMVDHTFLYNGAVRKIKEISKSDDFGKIINIDAVRINLGIIQNDVNVIWDLACHDISIINYLLDERPYSVQVNAISHLPNKVENIAYITLNYESNLIVHMHVSWSSPVKIRRMLIGGEHKMIVYDDIEPSDKLKIYEKNFVYISKDKKDEVLVDYRLGDILVPKFNLEEPLSLMAKDFYDAVINNKTPMANWQSALSVVSIIEKANESVIKGGVEVLI